MNGNGDICIGRYAGMWEAVQLDMLMCLIGILVRLFDIDMDTGSGAIFSFHLWYFAWWTSALVDLNSSRVVSLLMCLSYINKSK